MDGSIPPSTVELAHHVAFGYTTYYTGTVTYYIPFFQFYQENESIDDYSSSYIRYNPVKKTWEEFTPGRAAPAFRRLYVKSHI